MKRKFDIIRFKFKTPLHISNIRPDDYSKSERIFHSDSLYSAVFQIMAILGMQDSIGKNPSWTFSSLFPFLQGNKGDFHYFLKRPFYFNEQEKTFLSDPTNYKYSKDYKKTEYFEKDAFEKILTGDFVINPEFIQKPLYSANGIKLSDIFESAVNPRIVKPRTFHQSDPDIFYVERLFFRENGGLFCLVEADDASKKLLVSVLGELGQQGIGTDRNVGNGKFETEWDTLEFDLPDKAEYMMNTGLYLPEHKEELDQMTTEKSNWKLIKRGGWISEPYNTYRKKSVFMFAEGSVFKYKNNGHCILGSTARLTPENTPKPLNHEVYRIGKCLFLPINI